MSRPLFACLVLAALCQWAPNALAEYPNVSWAPSSINAPILVHTNGETLRDWEWYCDDPSDEFPLDMRCRVYDFTLGTLNSGADLLLVDDDCGSANIDPTTVQYSYNIPAAELTGGRQYAYAAYCRDSSTNPGTYSFTLWRWFWYDNIEPQVAIDSGPDTAAPNTATSASFQFSCDEDSYNYDFSSVNYEAWCDLWCALFDDTTGDVISGAKKCDVSRVYNTSEFGSHTYSGLTKGTYRFEVYGRDRVTNTSSTQTWVFEMDPPDSDPPDTEITASPPAITNITSATFEFVADEPNCDFNCEIRDASSALIYDNACTSPSTFNLPGNGTYTFTVLATDPAGNSDVDPNAETVSTYTWTIDTTAPETSIDAGCPQTDINGDSVTLEFGCDDAPCSFTCVVKRDGETVATEPNCTSPFTADVSEDGDYEVLVEASDDSDNADPSPALCGFKRDTVAPDTCIVAGPETLSNTSSGLKFDLECTPETEVCTYVCDMFWKRPDGTLDLRETEDPCTDGTTWSVGDATFVLVAYATDAAGNKDDDPTAECSAQWEFTVDTTPPPDPTIDQPDFKFDDCEPLIKGTTEPGATVTIAVDGQVVATVVADDQGIYEWQVPQGDCWPDGDYLISATAEDELGNTSGETNKPVELANDADDDGIADAVEDANGNGEVDEGETDPNNPDTDGDGLCDGDGFVDLVCQNGEDKNGNGQVDEGETDPLKKDTDDGGVDDGTEVLEQGTDPLEPSDDNCLSGTDCDGDGLSDAKEAEEGTDKFKPDSDGDGLLDGEEYYDYGTDPSEADTDGDGLSDGVEVKNSKTDPNDPDTDDDRLCDGSLTPEDGPCIGGEDMNDNGVIDEGESNPLLFDTDGGGVGDGDEVIDQPGPTSGNPLDPDDDFPFVLGGSGPIACSASGSSPSLLLVFGVLALAAFWRRRAHRLVY